jgi:hypothetical protein
MGRKADKSPQQRAHGYYRAIKAELHLLRRKPELRRCTNWRWLIGHLRNKARRWASRTPGAQPRLACAGCGSSDMAHLLRRCEFCNRLVCWACHLGKVVDMTGWPHAPGDRVLLRRCRPCSTDVT